ncbi:MAG: histidine kinase [Chloroflexota bacterium]
MIKIMKNIQRIRELKERIADLKQRWPAHSVPPALMLELDELEDELARVLEQGQQDEKDA